MRRTAWFAALAMTAFTGQALAFEDPPVTTAAAVLGAQATGPNYRVDPEVRSDGLLQLFILHTNFGTFEVAGQDLMRERIRELAALRKLNAMSESDVFLKSLGQTAAAPLRFGADLLTAPGATLRKSASGVANMFDRIGTAVTNEKSNRDNVVGSVLGVESAKRALAVQLGVDPYTDFQPLATKLTDVATASALGGLSMKALMMAIPGGAGVVVSSGSTVDTIRNTLAEKTAAQVVQQVLGTLSKVGVAPALAQRFVQNRNYTPTDLLVIATALQSMKVSGASIFIARAADADTREEAYFQRRRALLLTENAASLGIGSFVSFGGFPLNKLKDGRILALFPLDEVAWTPRVAAAFNKVSPAVTASGTTAVLGIRGALTPTARDEITRAGWTIVAIK